MVTKPAWITPKLEQLLDLLDGRIAGGAVRDHLMGKKPHDIDVATPIPAKAVEDVLDECMKGAYQIIPTGIAHGTVTVLFQNGEQYEVTTLRRDVETDGRHATVEFTDSWEEDAKRRDFTMNGLFMDAEGNIFDFVGGREDITNRVIRFIGDPHKRIHEDALRILRFYRFQSQLGFRGAGKSGDACVELRTNLRRLSRERIWQEFYKILLGEEHWYVINQMRWGKILESFLGDFEFHFYMYFYLQDDAILSLLCFGEWETLREKLLLPNDVSKRLATASTVSTLRSLPTGERDAHQLIYKMGSGGYYDFIRYSCALNNRRGLGDYLVWLRSYTHKKFPLTGDDLKSMGFKEGSDLGRVLRELEESWIASDFTLSHMELKMRALGE